VGPLLPGFLKQGVKMAGSFLEFSNKSCKMPSVTHVLACGIYGAMFRVCVLAGHADQNGSGVQSLGLRV
jgi:hypothetical protein